MDERRQAPGATAGANLLLEQDGPVAVVTFNRPEARNAMTFDMYKALACDLRLAAPHARFGAPVARTLGNFVAPTSLALLVATVGPVRARELVLTARLVDAAEAKAIGLVDEVHPAQALLARTRELAGGIAEHAPLTLAAAKEATRRLLAARSPGSLEDLILSCYLSQDFQEGVRAFLEKRKPRWQGR